MSQPSDPGILPRFEGVSGRQKLAEVLTRQILIAGHGLLAQEIVGLASLIEVLPGTPEATITVQGSADNDIYFIIGGSVSIQINGREIARRRAGSHVGEMALLDPTARRSATVIAVEPCVLARVSETDFSELAQQYPQLWRNIAVELADRLRQRSKYIRQPHNQAVVFVGSSSEQLEIAREIQLGLDHDPMAVRVWTDGVFRASRTSVESLLATVSESDFAVLVISPDDQAFSRGNEHQGPRDNVLFELGLFMGAIGHDRTFMVKPRGIDIKIPTDLLGVIPLDYAEGPQETLTERIAPVCTSLRRIIMQVGPR
jgi:CRP/FNR family cyclic AMP-dependent transcriptional regulator